MKIAISGKGGAGKTTVAALVAGELVHRGYRVTAIDADPNPTLGAGLGFPATPITPLLEMADEIEDRVGGAGVIRLNPRVDDLVEKIAVTRDGLDGLQLVVAGGVTRGGAGCACPQGVILRRLLEHVVLGLEEAVVIDLEAGLEHLGRRTAQAADALLVVVDPTSAGVETASRIQRLAGDIGLIRVAVVANRVVDPSDVEFISERLPDLEVVGAIPYSRTVVEAERAGGSLIGLDGAIGPAVVALVDRLAAGTREEVRT
ncbi:MAG TPA: AAA family ATPase [Candidatus Limnocylindrales bacterium]|nr:AAA family ATPase [Candidatus Limnocylindrales bacterium]